MQKALWWFVFVFLDALAVLFTFWISSRCFIKPRVHKNTCPLVWIVFSLLQEKVLAKFIWPKVTAEQMTNFVMTDDKSNHCTIVTNTKYRQHKSYKKGVGLKDCAKYRIFQKKTTRAKVLIAKVYWSYFLDKQWLFPINSKHSSSPIPLLRLK